MRKILAVSMFLLIAMLCMPSFADSVPSYSCHEMPNCKLASMDLDPSNFNLSPIATEGNRSISEKHTDIFSAPQKRASDPPTDNTALTFSSNGWHDIPKSNFISLGFGGGLAIGGKPMGSADLSTGRAWHGQVMRMR